MSEDERKQEALNEHSRRLLAHKEIDARVRTLREQVPALCAVDLPRLLALQRTLAVPPRKPSRPLAGAAGPQCASMR